MTGINRVRSQACKSSYHLNYPAASQWGHEHYHEQDFAIDGPGGERITGVEFAQQEEASETWLRFIKIVTNLGRRLEVEPWATGRGMMESGVEWTLGPSDGETITGMFAAASRSAKCLQSLGIHSLAINSTTGSPGRHR
ncbi:hypothetical protein ACJZ2D_009548 [Fusarium nematophilum]